MAASQFRILRFENQGGQVSVTCGGQEQERRYNEETLSKTVRESLIHDLDFHSDPDDRYLHLRKSSSKDSVLYSFISASEIDILYLYKTHRVESRIRFDWSRGCFSSDVIGISKTDGQGQPSQTSSPGSTGHLVCLTLSLFISFFLENYVVVTVLNGVKITKTTQQLFN